ncbi:MULTISPECIES: S8 family serine peptidase [Aphanothece]|uniref:S8 family serine peptidase n=1 Tax=Aphanothece TaxID=1121 RepID=UPI003984684D
MASSILEPWESSGPNRRSRSGEEEILKLQGSTSQEVVVSSDPLTGMSVTTAGVPLTTANTPPKGQVFQTSVDRVTGVPGTSKAAATRRLYIITLEDGGPPLSERAREVLGDVQPQALFKNLGMLTARLTSAQAAALERRGGVKRVEADQVVSLSRPDAAAPPPGKGPGGGGDAPAESTSQVLDWGVKWVWGNQDRTSTIGSFASKRAFVLDTGISPNTGDLNFDKNDPINKDFTGSRKSGFYDRNGHGTHVAGTIAAINNDRGVVGVAPGAKVFAIKVLNDQGSGTYSGIIAGIDYMMTVAGTGDVANLSLGGGYFESLNDAIQQAATEKGIRFSLAAGNSYADVDSFSPASAGNPAAGIYTISAHDRYSKNASFTNFDNLVGAGDVDNVAYAAPGVNITSLRIDGSTVAYSGTSMAAPHVAGLLLIGGFKVSTDLAQTFGGERTDPLAMTNLA